MREAAIATAGPRPQSRSPLLANVALLSLTLVVTLAVLEVVARFVFPAPLAWRHPQLRYRSDPTLGFAWQPNQRGFSADKEIAINDRGLRGALVPYERTPGVRRVLFLGDSITFGYGVRDDEVVSERVRARLAAAGISIEVVNAGVASYNSEQEAAYFTSEGRRYDPDVVVVGVCWNDINDKSEVRVAANGYLVDARNPGPASAAWSPLEFELRNFVKQSRLLYGSVERWRAYQSSRAPDDHAAFRSDVLHGATTPRVAAGWSQMEGAFTRLQRDVADRGARLLVVAFPMPLMLEGSFPESSYPARLREFTDRSGIAFLDLTDAFRSQFDGHESLFIAFDADHPNASGHDLAAREIVRMVQTWVS